MVARNTGIYFSLYLNKSHISIYHNLPIYQCISIPIYKSVDRFTYQMSVIYPLSIYLSFYLRTTYLSIIVYYLLIFICIHLYSTKIPAYLSITIYLSISFFLSIYLGAINVTLTQPSSTTLRIISRLNILGKVIILRSQKII